MPVPVPKATTETPKRAAVALPKPSQKQAAPLGVVETPVMAPVAILGADTRYRLSADDHPFTFAHNARCWDVATIEDVGDVWLPVLDRIRILPGAGQIHTVRKGEESNPEAVFGDEQKRRERLGWTFLDSTTLVGTVDVTDPMTGQKGIRYLDRWTQIERGVSGDADREIFDTDAYNRYRYNLVATGVLHPPSEVVKAKEIRRYRGRVARNVNNPGVPLEIRTTLIERAQVRFTQVAGAQIPKLEAT